GGGGGGARERGEGVVGEEAGEGGRGPAIDVGVGEGHQPFVPAAVVPGQRPGRQQRAERFEHGLEARAERDQVVVVGGRLVAFVPDLAEEVGRRQLPVVPGHDDLVAAHDRRDRVGGGGLAPPPAEYPPPPPLSP